MIAEYIKTHPNWKEELAALNIKIKEDEHFYIFNYDIAADFGNPLVQEARGIIIDKDYSVACFPFRKFGNFHEPYADNIDWSTARVQEKIDGSIVKLFWNKYSNTWQWATNSCINASEAETSFSNFLKLIHQADNYDFDFDKLNKNFTYIFELVSPYTKIVISYPVTHLYHIGTRSNLGQEVNIKVPMKSGGYFDKPKEYPLHSLQDCIKAVEALNSDTVEYEGFVVVDANWHRVKIKTPEYVYYHHFTQGISKSNILDILKLDDVNIDDLIKNFPEYEDIIRFYQNEILRLENEVSEFIVETRKFYNGDRKAFALKYSKHKYSMFAFLSIDTNLSARELLAKCTKNKYESYIRDYRRVK